jgi:NAD(P)-dependent dehydrogenase (short-subunit alcohol dehydrogenase family)
MSGMDDLHGKVIVITGASGGIGAAIAERVTRDGATAVIVARRAKALDDVAARCAAAAGSSGGRAIPIVADVTGRDGVRRVVARALELAGRIDVWINNVGQGIHRLPSELSDADIDEMMRINVKSALYGMQEALPTFRRQRAGQVINVSSNLGRTPTVLHRAAYSAAKHFLSALTQNVRMELAESMPYVTVSLVSPGVVYTDFGKNASHGGPDSREIGGGQEPAEVADVVARVIRERRTDVYTRPGAQRAIAEYYAGLGSDP